jgi:hypothetical protein
MPMMPLSMMPLSMLPMPLLPMPMLPPSPIPISRHAANPRQFGPAAVSSATGGTRGVKRTNVEANLDD